MKIASYIVYYDPDHSEGSYQFADLEIIEGNGDIINWKNEDHVACMEEQYGILLEDLQLDIQAVVGKYFYENNVESLLQQKLKLPIKDVNIEIESL